MRLAIMQPTYLPWLGYFNLIARSDAFVFLDDVEFSRQSWQQRNRIIVDDRILWLTVPVLTTGRYGQRINEVEIQNSLPWRRKQLVTLAESLAKAPFKQPVIDRISSIMVNGYSKLSELNIALIKSICDFIGLQTPMHMASDLGCIGGRSDRLLAMCAALGATDYLSPAGSRDYLANDGVFSAAGFPVSFQSYTPPIYRKSVVLDAGTFPSIVDALAWVGPSATIEMVSKGVK